MNESPLGQNAKGDSFCFIKYIECKSKIASSNNVDQLTKSFLLLNIFTLHEFLLVIMTVRY